MGRMVLAAVVAVVTWSAAGPAGADPAAAPAEAEQPAGSTTTTTPPPSPTDPQAEPPSEPQSSYGQPQSDPAPQSATAGSTATGPAGQEQTAAPASAPGNPEDRPSLAYLRDPRTPRERAAAYAYRWALSTNPEFAFAVRGRTTVPSNNKKQRGRAIDERNAAEVDCTSFVSQALRAGGFEYTKKWNFDRRRRTATVAWVRAGGKDGLAALFLKLGRTQLLNPGGAGPGQAPPAGIQIGDVIGWDPYVRPHQMRIDHHLVVTEVRGDGRSWADIHVSYHTHDHRNRAMDEYAATYREEISAAARLYVFHVRYPKVPSSSSSSRSA